MSGCVCGRPADHLPPRAVRYTPKCICDSSGVQKKRANCNRLDPWKAPRNKTKRHEARGGLCQKPRRLHALLVTNPGPSGAKPKAKGGADRPTAGPTNQFPVKFSISDDACVAAPRLPEQLFAHPFRCPPRPIVQAAAIPPGRFTQ